MTDPNWQAQDEPPTQPLPASYGIPSIDAEGYRPIESKRKSRVWLWLLVILGVLIIGIGGCSYVFYQTVKGPVDTANDFLAAVDAGDFATASDLSSSSPACFGQTAQADLEPYLDGNEIESYDLNSSNVSSSGGSTTAEVSGTIESAGEHTIVFSMIKESGNWRVCGLTVN